MSWPLNAHLLAVTYALCTRTERTPACLDCGLCTRTERTPVCLDCALCAHVPTFRDPSTPVAKLWDASPPAAILEENKESSIAQVITFFIDPFWYALHVNHDARITLYLFFWFRFRLTKFWLTAAQDHLLHPGRGRLRIHPLPGRRWSHPVAITPGAARASLLRQRARGATIERSPLYTTGQRM